MPAQARVYAQRVNFPSLLLPDFVLILFGFLLCRLTPLNRSVWEQVESVVYYVLFPLLLFYSIVRSPLDVGATSRLMLGGLLTGACGIALAYSLPWWPWVGRHIDRRAHAASAQIAFRFNSFVALALAERLSGPAGLALIAVLIGVCVPLFNLGAVWPMARHGQHHFGRAMLRNPLVLATASGLIANLSGFTMPTWAQPSLTRMGNATLVLGLMSAGAGMQFSALANGKVLAVSVLGIRHVLTPFVALAVSLGLALPREQQLTLLAFSAMPTAPSAYLLAAKMGYDGAYVAGLVTLSTVAALLSLPMALGLVG